MLRYKKFNNTQNMYLIEEKISRFSALYIKITDITQSNCTSTFLFAKHIGQLE